MPAAEERQTALSQDKLAELLIRFPDVSAEKIRTAFERQMQWRERFEELSEHFPDMSNEEIHRNKAAVTFVPCAVCRQDGSIYNNEYQTASRYSGEPDHEPADTSRR